MPTTATNFKKTGTNTEKRISLKNRKSGVPFLLTAALLLRVILAYTCRGFESDTACFYSWASMLWDNGFADFYSPDYFCDYPPGYLYILFLLGGLLKLFGIDTLSGLCLFVIKTPAILCDLAAGYLICRYAGRFFKNRTALLLAAGYLFHPAVLINSSVWGQVDAVYTLVIVLVCILLSDHKYIPGYFLFAVGILLKPQTLIFAPLILCALAEYIASQKSLKKIIINLAGGIAAVLMIVLLGLPFGLDNVIGQYTDTLSSYPYAAVNACNLWGLFGQNWISQDTTLGPVTYAQIGTFCIVLMTLCAFFIFYSLRRRTDRYYLTGAFLVVSMFLFSVRMHERYLFPAMLLLLFTFIHNREKGYYCHYWLLSLCHFCNVYYVLYYYNPANYDRRSFPLLSISFLTMFCGIIFYRSLIKSCTKHADSAGSTEVDGDSWLQPNFEQAPNQLSPGVMLNPVLKPLRKQKYSAEKPIQTSRPRMPLTKVDILIMTGLSLFYGIFAFINLGITKTPVTECSFPCYTYLELEAEDGQSISSIYWYLKNEQDITCQLEVRETAESDWTYLQDIELGNVFSWSGMDLPSPVTAIRITNVAEDTHIGELVFTDSSQNIVNIKQQDAYFTLFDETDTFPGTLNAQSSAYFDEIYYTRTVYEYMNGLPAFENTHPPFGKILIWLGALMFGTSPFGFRFVGALLGVLMLPFMYLLGRNITKSRFIGGFTAFLFAFDFMHFAQTRLATIDVFITFFIIVMYYFMEQYANMSFYDTPLKKTFLPLGACGIAFGFGIATKWTGFYAGAGLAIIFFLQLYRRFREYRCALADPNGSTAGISHRHIIGCFMKYTARTIGFCIIFFVGIPFMIYLLSYIPFVDGTHTGLFAKMAANQVTMFNYHSYLTATHPYSSSWYEWPTMLRPIFYYSKHLEGNLRLGISSFGNPLVWWAGIPAFLGTCYLALARRKKEALFLIIGYLAQYLPWVLVDRCTFIYHYFPSVPFVVLMLGYCFLQFKEYMSSRSFYLSGIGYAAAAFILFLLFYPVLAGTPVSTEYVDTVLRWMDSWVLVLN